ncbi:MAG TPA: hypothetical protein PLA53_01645 [bacterium]|nr:hypothetical protein [bacterium]HPL22571.1 hypothetical protein [bacterium]HPX64119.1 hypothetical protein [bacterium]
MASWFIFNPFFCCHFFGAYFIARRYISQEVTFYSRLIYYLDNNLSDKEFLKIFHQEGQVLSHFDRLVALDSFFRIRRDVWLKASSRLLFIVLLLLVSFLQLNSGNLLSLINLSDSHNFSRLFLIVYLSRLANEALRIGLYWFPAKLGLYLTIVRSVGQLKFPQIFKIDKTIVFYSPKTKLFQQSAYYRRLSFSFKPGDRILFTGPNLSGKTRLARLLAGQGAYLPKSIHVKIDGRRFNYCQWQEIFGGAYLLDQTLATTEKSLMEFLLGRDKQNIDLADIEKILAVVNKQKIIKDLVAADGNLNRSVRVIDNHSSFFALQAAYCLINRPALIVVDNFWLDLGYNDIRVILNIMSQQLSDSIIICFSGQANKFLNYHQHYAIKAQEIS